MYSHSYRSSTIRNTTGNSPSYFNDFTACITQSLQALRWVRRHYGIDAWIYTDATTSIFPHRYWTIDVECKLLRSIRFPRDMGWLQQLTIKNGSLASAPNLDSFPYLTLVCLCTKITDIENNMIEKFEFPKTTEKLESLCLCKNIITMLFLPLLSLSRLSKLCASNNTLSIVSFRSTLPKLTSIELSNLWAYTDNNELHNVDLSQLNAQHLT